MSGSASRAWSPAVEWAHGLPSGCCGALSRRNARTTYPHGSTSSPAACSSRRDSMLERALVAGSVGRASRSLVLLSQVHGREVVYRGEPEDVRPAADAQWTDRTGVTLGILVADCCPVIIADAHRRLVGIAHAGWRGAADGVVPALIEALIDAGSDSARLAAWVGPCAERTRYEVGPEVAARFEAIAGVVSPVDARSPASDRYLLDLQGVVRHQIASSGVDAGAIALSRGMTIADRTYHSYRRDRDLSGRMLAMAWLGYPD